MCDLLNRAWAEIDLDNVVHNIQQIRNIVSPKTKICAVLKADAYGHGVIEMAKICAQNGIAYVAVSMLDEAIQLRNSGFDLPILVLGYTEPKRASEIIYNDIVHTIFSRSLAQALSDAAIKMGKSVKIHIKVDTGMSRVGFLSGYEGIKNIIQISKMPGLILEGIFTHFASADEQDTTYTDMQFERFISICEELNRVGIHIPVKHVCNSAGILQCKNMHLDMVRPGIILYGLYPSSYLASYSIKFRPAMRLKANVAMIKDLEAEVPIGYNRTFTTAKKSRIAVVPIGYADGYPTLLNNTGKVLIKGEFAPIAGKICMDQCMIDITNMNTEVKVGDEVILFGEQGAHKIEVSDIASQTGMLHYELVCNIGKRIPRVYIKDQKIYNVFNYLI